MKKLLKMNKKTYLLSSIAIFTILIFILFSRLNRDMFLTEPKLGSYRSDEMIFLKTFYLMEENENYYKAFKTANEGDMRGKKMTNDVFTWRLPSVFYFWKFTAESGKQILANFWILVFLSLISSYFLLRKFLNPWLALAGPILLLPYFADAFVYKTSFLFTEWWAWFFGLFGLTFFVYQKKLPAWIFLLLAVFTRELMMMPIISFLLISLLFKKNRIFFLSIIFCFFVLLFFHQKTVYEVLELSGGNNFSNLAFGRIHNFNKPVFFKMISFSLRQFPLVKYKSHLLIFAAAFFSLILNLYKNYKIKNIAIYYFLIYGWSLAVILPFISSSQYNDYWGILFMPTLILTIPLIFKKNENQIT